MRHEGAGALIGLPANDLAYLRSGCVRDGVRRWGVDPGFRLRLSAGQTARLTVTVRVPDGWTTPAMLGLKIAEWSATPVADTDLSVLGGGTGSSLLEIPVPRRAGRDAVSLSSRSVRPGVVRLDGLVTPARAGTVVELIGRSAAKASDTRGLDRLGTALKQSGPSRRLAVVKTDSDGRWVKQLRLPLRTAIVARTKGGFDGSRPGASCPLTLGG